MDAGDVAPILQKSSKSRAMRRQSTGPASSGSLTASLWPHAMKGWFDEARTKPFLSAATRTNSIAGTELAASSNITKMSTHEFEPNPESLRVAPHEFLSQRVSSFGKLSCLLDSSVKFTISIDCA
jgi:hypothetical protein